MTSPCSFTVCIVQVHQGTYQEGLALSLVLVEPQELQIHSLVLVDTSQEHRAVHLMVVKVHREVEQTHSQASPALL